MCICTPFLSLFVWLPKLPSIRLTTCAALLRHMFPLSASHTSARRSLTVASSFLRVADGQKPSTVWGSQGSATCATGEYGGPKQFDRHSNTVVQFAASGRW